MNANDKHKRAFLIWLAIYPLITILFLLMGDSLSAYPLGIRTFILTAIAVPIVFYIILPFYNKLFKQWLHQNK
jgi:antibiotic biosynthesis monooxygenase (ABM) superfamily enzyme